MWNCPSKLDAVAASLWEALQLTCGMRTKCAVHKAATTIVSERTVESNRSWAGHVVDDFLK
jgi:hypothetical protein